VEGDDSGETMEKVSATESFMIKIEKFVLTLKFYFEYTNDRHLSVYSLSVYNATTKNLFRVSIEVHWKIFQRYKRHCC
jgi:hypothetical protein